MRRATGTEQPIASLRGAGPTATAKQWMPMVFSSASVARPRSRMRANSSARSGHAVTVLSVRRVGLGPRRSRTSSSDCSASSALPRAVVWAGRRLPIAEYRRSGCVDVAEVVAFVAAPAAAFVTGEIIDVNGGSWMDR